MRYLSADEQIESFIAYLLGLLGEDKEPVTIQQDGEDVAVVLSPEQFDMLSNIRERRVEEFFASRDALAEEAQRNGLTKEKLAELLDE